jgi:hypothetical protein
MFCKPKYPGTFVFGIKDPISHCRQPCLNLYLGKQLQTSQIFTPLVGTGGHPHEGNTMRKIMVNKPQVSSAIIIHSPLQISWNDLYQGRTVDVSIIRAKTGTFSIETLAVHLAP